MYGRSKFNRPPGTAFTPTMLATWSFGRPAIASAWEKLLAGGSSLDAVETACRHAEDDPDNATVGVGGLPDSGGVMSLDAAVMLSPGDNGAVCATGRVPNPITLARAVMQTTPHSLLAGPAADAFAVAHGLPVGNTLSDSARRRWEAWVAADQPFKPQLNIEESNHDTIGVLALDATGRLAGGCSTSGMAWKLPGRVGDSPVIGHGMYVDPAAGGCAISGHGELVSGICGAFLAVETLRRGGSAVDAVAAVLQRLDHAYDLHPNDQAVLVVMTPTGRVACGSLRPGFSAAVRTPDRDELVPPDVVYFP